MTEQSRKFAKNQILRLAMLANFPAKSPPALTDLIDALMEAPSEELAKAVIDYFKESAAPESRCPMESEIKAEINRRQDAFRPDPDCPRCKGNGDIYYLRTNSSKRCDCWARRPAPVYPKASVWT